MSRSSPFPQSFAGRQLAQRRLIDFVVSKTAYSENQALPHHTHELSYISIALRGSYTEQHETRSSEVLPGEVILHVPGESHSNQFHKQGGEVLNLEFCPGFFERISGLCHIEVENRLSLRSLSVLHLGSRILKEFSSTEPTAELALEGLAMELVAEIFRERTPTRKMRRCEWLDTVTDMLNDRYSQSITLNEMSACVSIHPVHLARAFRKRHLCTIGEYIRKLRIEAACRELIQSNATIAEVALRTGFSDQSHLCRVLSKNLGMSPSQFRKAKSFKIHHAEQN